VIGGIVLVMVLVGSGAMAGLGLIGLTADDNRHRLTAFEAGEER
jgi:NADH:ubiquinone oxidoreductase subunit 3 (subunit A)